MNTKISHLFAMVALMGCADINEEGYSFDESEGEEVVFNVQKADTQQGEAAEAEPAQEAPSAHVNSVRTAAEPWWSSTTSFPYDSDNLADWVQYQWRNQLNIRKDTSPYMAGEVTRQGATLHNWTEGNGYLMTDFHGVEVKLDGADPKRNAQALLRLMRDNPAALGGGYGTTDFTDEVSWPSTQPDEERSPGDVIFLDLYGPDNAAIAYIDTDISDNQFCVMTVTHPQTGWHPVNGVRCWGYIEWTRAGHFTHLFYTTGVDSTTAAGAGWVGAPLQFETWNAQMVALARQVECVWGAEAGYVWEDDEVQEWLNKAPGSIVLTDVDHLGGWDDISDATPQFEFPCN